MVWMSDEVSHALRDGYGEYDRFLRDLVHRFVLKAQSKGKRRGFDPKSASVGDLKGRFSVRMWPLPVSLRGEKTSGLIAVVLIPTYETLLADVTHGFCLSQREAMALQGIAEGFSTKQIASRLRISTPTVQTYRVRLARKLHLDNPMAITGWLLKMFWSGIHKTDPVRFA